MQNSLHKILKHYKQSEVQKKDFREAFSTDYLPYYM